MKEWNRYVNPTTHKEDFIIESCRLVFKVTHLGEYFITDDMMIKNKHSVQECSQKLNFCIFSTHSQHNKNKMK